MWCLGNGTIGKLFYVCVCVPVFFFFLFFFFCVCIHVCAVCVCAVCVAHVQLDGVDQQPATLFSRRVNIDRAVEFLRKDGVAFQGDPVKGEGRRDRVMGGAK